MGDRASKDALFDSFADVAKALANGRRTELIDVLAQGERHVEELADEIGQSVANTSFHLRTLAQAGLVATRRERTRIYYRLASEQVDELWVTLRATAAAHHRELDDLATAYLGHRDELEQIDRAELAENPSRPLLSERWGSCIDAVGGDTLAHVLTEIRYGGAVAACGLAGGNGLATTVVPVPRDPLAPVLWWLGFSVSLYIADRRHAPVAPGR